MTARRIATLLLLLAMVSVSAWGAITITNGAPTSPVVIGQSYSFQFTASVPATWTLTGGALPPGLTLFSNGLLSGQQLKQVDTFSFTVTATPTDPAQLPAVTGCTAVVGVNCNIVVNNGPPVIDKTTFNPKAGVGIAYSDQLGVLGGTGPFTWLLTPATNDGISISSSTGLLSGTPVSSGSVSLNVKVSDSVGAFTSTVLQLNVIGIDTATLPPGAKGTAYSQFLQASGGVLPLSWTLSGDSPLPPGLSLSSNGVISGTPTTDGTYPFSVTVTDVTQNSITKALTIVIDSTFRIITTTLPNATIGAAYSQFLQASGGVLPLSWTLSGTTPLPPGLSLSNNGVISGTPTTNGSYPFSVTVTDFTQMSATKALTIVVGSGFSITTATLPNATIGTAYSQTLQAAGGVLPLSWSLSGTTPLPPGLSLSTTGIISGTPTTNGTYPFSVTVTDSTQISVAKVLTIVVGPTLSITTATLPNAAIGISYSQTLVATGGAPAYTWSASGLPPGLTLDPATGILSGTPTAVGPQTISVTVTDTTKGTASARLALTIDTLAISTTALPNGFTSVAYSGALAVSGGQTSLAWAITSGSLPNGLTLNPATGAITGTPNTAGSFPFTVAVSYTPASPSAVSVSQAFTIQIVTVPTLTFTGFPTAAGQQLPLAGTISTGYPLDITGTLQVTFAPAAGLPDDPNIQFVQSTASSRQVAFTIAAGSTQATFKNGATRLASGTVAGTITITTTALTDSSGASITPPAPSTITINPTAPVITKVVITNATSSGFTVSVTGYSTPRDMTSALFTFTPTTGTTLGATTATVQLGTAFTNWYGTTTSNAYGSQFTVSVPFTFTSTGVISAAPVAALTVSLTNSKATSTTSGSVSP